MLKVIFPGEKFFYANRNTGKVEKCEVINTKEGHPTKIYAVKDETKEIFLCYNGFGCYELEEYDEALQDAQTKKERFVY